MKKYVKFSVIAFLISILVDLFINNEVFVVVFAINLFISVIIYIDNYVNDFDEIYNKNISNSIDSKFGYEDYLEQCRIYEQEPFDRKTFNNLNNIPNVEDFIPSELDDQLGKKIF